MMVLPRFLYLFQNLPIYLTKSFFKNLDSIIFPFIWSFKTHRISKAHLEKSKEMGGLAMPVFQHYYWAANVRALMYWSKDSQYHIETDDFPTWIHMESHSVIKSSLPALLLSNLNTPLKSITKHFVVHSSLRILKQIKKFLGITRPSVHSSICKNHNFTPGLSNRIFQLWNNKGLSTFNDLYTDGRFASFEHLLGRYSLSHSHFY